MPRAPSSQFLSLPAAAASIGFSTSTLRRWIREGRLRSYRVTRNSHPRVRVSDVQELLVAERDLPTPGPDMATIFDALAEQWDEQEGRTRRHGPRGTASMRQLQ